MKDTFRLTDFPEVMEIYGELLTKVLGESLRGAVILGATYVDEHLKNCLIELMPFESKKKISETFNFTSPLGTFSSRIRMAYCFRYINDKLYNSLNALRDLRNDAAHKKREYTAEEIDNQLDRIFDFGEVMRNYIRTTAIRMQTSHKFELINEMYDEFDIPKEERKVMFERVLYEEGGLERIKEQHPFWELTFGLSILCSLISFERDRLKALLAIDNTWVKIGRKIAEK